MTGQETGIKFKYITSVECSQSKIIVSYGTVESKNAAITSKKSKYKQTTFFNS